MRVLLIHNYYQQPGGEDLAYSNEAALLKAHGDHVVCLPVSNHAISEMSRLSLAKATFWNRSSYTQILDIVKREAVQVCHFHNTFPLVSPAAYYAAKRAGVAVVQTLHNYRLICPGATLFRDGRPCEECLGRLIPWPGIMHRCYRDSRAITGVVAGMLSVHRLVRTWAKTVDTYIALTEFAREKLAQGGLPGEKIVLKRNFIELDPGLGTGKGGFALFIGRLVPEKGIQTMIAAWKLLDGRFPLKIVGAGPLTKDVVAASEQVAGIEHLGRIPDDELDVLLGQASFLLFPSEWYEGLPRTIIESFAKGTPVIASKLGSMVSLVSHRQTGLHFRAGDPQDLASVVRWAIDHKGELLAMRQAAREEFETKYTAEQNYQQLRAIYERAIHSASNSGRRRGNALPVISGLPETEGEMVV